MPALESAPDITVTVPALIMASALARESADSEAEPWVRELAEAGWEPAPAWVWPEQLLAPESPLEAADITVTVPAAMARAAERVFPSAQQPQALAQVWAGARRRLALAPRQAASWAVAPAEQLASRQVALGWDSRELALGQVSESGMVAPALGARATEVPATVSPTAAAASDSVSRD